jgi:hypothetical protein
VCKNLFLDLKFHLIFHSHDWEKILYCWSNSTSSLLEGVINVFYVDFPLERHIANVLQIDDGFPSTFSRSYFNALQHWIELACAGTCYHFLDFSIGCYGCIVISCCRHNVIYIPTYMSLIFYVTLFQIITKHKGRVHGLEMMLGWSHWLFDFT